MNMEDASNRVVTKDDEAPLVPAVFPDRRSAARGVETLMQEGVARADIGVAVPVRQTDPIRDDSEQEVLRGAGVGAALGARLGIVGSIVLAAAAFGPLGVGGLFLAGASGLLWGGTVGGLIGVVTRVRRYPNEDRWSELGLNENNVLVAVRVRDWAAEPEIAAMLKRAGATDVLDRMDLDHSWRELELEHHSGASAPGS